MLKQDKLRLSLVLSALYAIFFYFRFKKDGTIICKKNWWSIKRHKTDLKELATETIPNAMAPYSEYEACNYQTLINAVAEKNNSSKLIAVMEEYFTKFRKGHSFGGIPVDTKWPFNVRGILKYDFKKLVTKETWLNIWSKLKAKLDIRLVKPRLVANVKSVVTSVEAATNSKLELVKKTIGSVCTGNAELDNKYRTIIRYLSPDAQLYCI